MVQLIDKSALVAEIKKRINFNERLNAYPRLDECNAILSFIDTLEVKEVDLDEETTTVYCDDFDEYSEIKHTKPYLRPMSSMTKEEHKEYEQWLPDGYCIDTFDWLNAHHFDYRGLIPMGLAIEVTEENNPYNL